MTNQNPSRPRVKKWLPVALLVFVMGFLSQTVVADNSAGDPPSASTDGFRAMIIEMTKTYVQKRRDEIEAERKKGNITEARRIELDKELANLNDEIDNTAGRVNDIYSILSGLKKDIKALDKQYRENYGGTLPSNPAFTSINALEQAKVLKLFNDLNKGADWLVKLKVANDRLNATNALGTSGPGRSIAYKLTLLAEGLSWFGGKVPVIGSIVKAYGDVSTGMLSEIYNLETKMRAREGDQLIDGVSGDRSMMLEKLRAMGFTSGVRVSGLKHAYVFLKDEIPSGWFIWEPASESFTKIEGLPSGQEENTLRERYTLLARSGNMNPSGAQIAGFKRALNLRIEVSAEQVTPGQRVNLTVFGVPMEPGWDPAGRPVEVKVFPEGSGSFVSNEPAKLGQPVGWFAPSELPDDAVYRFEASIPAEQQEGIMPLGKATARVRAGTVTRMNLIVSTNTVVPGQQIDLQADVQDVLGASITGSYLGRVEFSSDGGGQIIGSKSLADRPGEQARWRAPLKPGTYTIKATYEGGSRYSAEGSAGALIGCKASAQIQVRETNFDVSISPDSATVTAAGAASVTVSVTNRESVEVPFSMISRTNKEGDLWTVSNHNQPMTIPAGETRTVSFTVALKDVVAADKFALRIYPSPFGGQREKYVTLSLHNGDPAAAVNAPKGCDEALRTSCRAAVESAHQGAMGACAAKGTATVAGFTCAMEQTVDAAEKLRACATESRCEVAKVDDAWEASARQALACARTATAATLPNCANAVIGKVVCDNGQKSKCITDAAAAYSSALAECGSGIEKDSCDYCRCVAGVNADRLQQERTCATNALCDEPEGTAAEGAKQRKKSECIQRNELQCSSCLDASEKSAHNAFVAKAEAARTQSQGSSFPILSAVPPIFAFESGPIKKVTPTGITTATSGRITSATPNGGTTTISGSVKSVVPGSVTTVTSGTALSAIPEHDNSAAKDDDEQSQTQTDTESPRGDGLPKDCSACKDNPMSMDCLACPIPSAGVPAEGEQKGQESALKLEPSVAASFGVGVSGSGTPSNPWVGKKRPKYKAGRKKYHWNTVNSTEHKVVGMFFKECNKHPDKCSVKGYHDCYKLPGPGAVVVCQARMVSTDGSANGPISVDMSWRNPK
ncbi:MAG: Ig-like domain repeat protein [Deltaproteobacteria bacterium]|nr:Ig-like domain repeat protein [Deltaproteobacteria bacterium]MBN2671288.1 Ig-like domain repeat protein [Deltaproteobacteria bacterium]